MTVQTMNGNVTPPFCYCWTHFWSTFWSSNYAYHILCQILGSQESRASNGMRFGGEMKKLWSFEDKCAKLSENFATETPFGRVFRSYETNFWHTSAICSTFPLIFEAAIQLQNHLWAAKPLFGTREPFRSPRTLILQLQNGLRNQFWDAKSLLSFEMAAKWSPSFEMPVKSPPSFEMAFKLGNWLAK